MHRISAGLRAIRLGIQGRTVACRLLVAAQQPTRQHRVGAQARGVGWPPWCRCFRTLQPAGAARTLGAATHDCGAVLRSRPTPPCRPGAGGSREFRVPDLGCPIQGGRVGRVRPHRVHPLGCATGVVGAGTCPCESTSSGARHSPAPPARGAALPRPQLETSVECKLPATKIDRCSALHVASPKRRFRGAG